MVPGRLAGFIESSAPKGKLWIAVLGGKGGAYDLTDYRDKNFATDSSCKQATVSPMECHECR